MKNVTKISFIGTGNMGKPMIFKLLDKGYHIQVYDKYKEAADTVVAAGAVWKETPKEAAENTDIVMTCLPLPHHVLENMKALEMVNQNLQLPAIRKFLSLYLS